MRPRLSSRLRRRAAGALVAMLMLPALAAAFDLEPPFSGPLHDCVAGTTAVVQDAGGFYEGRLADGTPLQANLPEKADGAPRDAPPASIWLLRDYGGRPWTASVRTVGASVPGGLVDVVVELDDTPPGRRRSVPFWTLAARISVDGTRVSGTASLPGHDAPQAFELVRVARYRHVHLVQPQAPAHEDLPAGVPPPPSGPYAFDATWPELADAQVSAQARAEATACRGSGQGVLTEWRVVTVAWHGPGAVGLRSTYEVMPVGAAHPADVSRTLNFAWQSKAFRHVALDDVLAPGEACRDAVTMAIQARLRRQGIGRPQDGGLRAENFLALPRGVAFFFDPVEVEARVYGDAQAFVQARTVPGCLRALPAPPP